MVFLVATVRVTVTGSYEGIFLLRGDHGAVWELKDDLFLNEGPRYIFGIDFHKEYLISHTGSRNSTKTVPHLYFEWNDKAGDGFVRNYLPDGKQLFTSFGRFIDDSGARVSGLFIGGGLPSSVKEDAELKKNDTGIAYYNGVRWVHIWCTANEALSNFSSFEPIYPSRWRFLGGKVLAYDGEDLILKSSHDITNGAVPLRMDRYAYFRAGETYFILEIVIKNTGRQATTFFYLYGDEPWLGDYGSSEGNVGWAADGIHRFEGYIDTEKNHFAGLYDYGNEMIGEPHTFTRVANFLEWNGSESPKVYFANNVDYVTRDTKTPLSGNSRFIGLNWGPRTLEPGQTVTYLLAIGMAGHDDTTDLPVKPDVHWKNFP
jgi:hypothetical protein